MQLLLELQREHALIEQVAGALRTYLADPGAPAADGPRFIDFFRCYAGEFHHRREEEVLFAALAREASLPVDRGPVAALLRDHRALDALLGGFLRAPDSGARAALAGRYVEALLHHIDAESSVLFPESQERLRRVGVLQLDAPPASAAVLQACASGGELVRRYPPPADDGLMRGDGCVLCPSFGAGCEGIEHTWWTEDEWGELADRTAGD